MNRLIHMAIASWCRRQEKKAATKIRNRYLRTVPEIKQLYEKFNEASRKHRRTREIERQMHEITLNNLRAR